jgi:DNA end-binding protein Ku
VLAMIERKAQGETIAVQPAPEEDAEPAPDLMSALKASLDAVRARDADTKSSGDSGKTSTGKQTTKKARAKKAATTKKAAATTKKVAVKKPPADRAAKIPS